MSTTEQPSYLYPSVPAEPVVEPEPEQPKRPSWYKRSWVRRTAVATVIVVLTGATIGLVQRNSQLNSTVDSKTAQVHKVTGQLASTKTDLTGTKAALASSQRESDSLQAEKAKLSTETVTCVNGMVQFLTNESSDLTAYSLGDFSANATASQDPGWASTCHDARVDAGG